MEARRGCYDRQNLGIYRGSFSRRGARVAGWREPYFNEPYGVISGTVRRAALIILHDLHRVVLDACGSFQS